MPERWDLLRQAPHRRPVPIAQPLGLARERALMIAAERLVRGERRLPVMAATVSGEASQSWQNRCRGPGF